MSEAPPVSALVDEWLAWCAWVSDPANRDRFDGPSGHSEFLWAVEEHPERAWEAILKLVEDSSAHCYLGQLAAGPIEDLLSYHGQQFIDRVETTARANPTFASTLSGVWQFTMGEDIWARVQAVKGEELTGQVNSGTPNKSLERTREG
jgi:hypothetical protein